ncbi:TIGR04104 family putative zinc finger protein [Sporosarcina aquimarina]|uniref:Cxxc_20_cxxc protein n=1 Tax=Sporosarcina aquimarina TaxID=114975 RepID=A0ABU4G3F3_9BACL|nr:TIGR04104 family putative zinc finger protein [Sporosarcina aquimarina]MDW0110897.1 hypothetical protein [Sporosarcina aquimarina]
MDSIKEQLNAELQKITFDDERKQELIHSVKNSRKPKTRAPVWTYRIVLSSFVLLSMAFGWINQNAENPSSVTQADGGGTLTIMDLLGYDSVKTLLLAILFFIIYGLFIRSIRKEGRTLPVCANCGAVWTHKLALKKAFRNEKTACPNCGEMNYQTRKSRKKTSLFQLFIPVMIIAANLFEHGIYGMVIYLAFLALLTIRLVPFYVELQLENPMDEPWW